MNYTIILRVLFALAGASLSACGGGGGGDASAGPASTAPAPPPANPPPAVASPSAFVARGASSTEIDLVWRDNAYNETGFRVERKVDATGTFSEVALVPANSTGYFDNGLTAGATYYYRVQAFTATANSDYTPEVSATTAATRDRYWARSYSGPDDSHATAIARTADDGYIVVGHVDVETGLPFHDNAWVIKLDMNGAVSWQRNLNGISIATSVVQTSDGGYVVAGSVAGAPSVFKLDAAGAVLWHKSYATLADTAVIKQDADGNYIVAAGSAVSYNGPIVMKLDPVGEVIWFNRYATDAAASAVVPTAGGGYIVSGHRFRSGPTPITSDFWVLRLNAAGATVWEKTFDNGDTDRATAVLQTDDNADGIGDGFIVGGYTDKNLTSIRNDDWWLIKLDANGAIQWQQTYGGIVDDVLYALQSTADGGYIAAGMTDSFAYSSTDFWLLRLTSTGTISWQKSYGETGGETAHTVAVAADGGFVAAGRTNSFSLLDSAMWILKTDSTGDFAFNANFPNARARASSATVEATAVSAVDVASGIITPTPPRVRDVGATTTPITITISMRRQAP